MVYPKIKINLIFPLQNKEKEALFDSSLSLRENYRMIQKYLPLKEADKCIFMEAKRKIVISSTLPLYKLTNVSRLVIKVY